MPSSVLDWLIEHEPSFRKTRLPSLYSDLSVQKISNPEGFAANVTAWTSALTRLALNGQLPPEQNHFLLQTSDDLLSALASPVYGRPSGLGCVIDEAVRQGKMIEQKDFMASEKSIYHRSWIPGPWTVVKWGLKQVGIVGNGSYDSSGRLRSGNLVVVPALEELARLVSSAVKEKGAQGLTDRILSREAFLQQINSLLDQKKSTSSPVATRLSDQDLNLLLRYLSRDKQILSYDSTTIKYHVPNTPSEPITQEDRSIATLKHLITNLTQQTTTLETRIATLQTTAHTAVKQNNKTSALSALRSKKLAETTLTSRLATLHQLEQVYTRIEAAADQVQIISVMESSAGVLKSLNKQVGGVERVEDVLETLRSEMDKVDEVSGVIAEPVTANQALVNEDEVDEEFERLEREERAKNDEIAAENTRRRLAELDHLEKERLRRQQEQEQEQAKQQQQQEQETKSQTKEHERDAEALEDQLSQSVERLKTLDLNMNGNPTDVDGNKPADESQQRTAQENENQQDYKDRSGTNANKANERVAELAS